MQRERSATGCRYENGGKKMSSEWLSSWVNTRISVLMSGIFTMTKWNICQFFINNFCRSAPEGNIVRLRLACGITGKNEGIPVIISMPERTDKPLRDVAVWECPSGTMTVCLAKKQKGDLIAFCAPETGISFFDLYRIGKRRCSAFALESDRFSERHSPAFCERNETDMWFLRRRRWELSW